MKHLKSLFLLLTSLICCHELLAQNIVEIRKYIDVTGSAEMNVDADEIELEITIVEFENYSSKVKLDSIVQEFYKILKNNHPTNCIL